MQSYLMSMDSFCWLSLEPLLGRGQRIAKKEERKDKKNKERKLEAGDARLTSIVHCQESSRCDKYGRGWFDTRGCWK